MYVRECKTVCASNKQGTQSPDKCGGGGEIQKWLEGEKKRNKENKSIKGKVCEECLWLAVKQIAGVEPGRNYHSGQIKMCSTPISGARFFFFTATC